MRPETTGAPASPAPAGNDPAGGLLARHWWVFTVRGVLALLFGLMALVWPGVTLFVLTIVFGSYALVDGIFASVGAFRASRGHRAPLVLEAVVGVVWGAMALFWPGVTVLTLTLLVGIWAGITGVTRIVSALMMRDRLHGTGMSVIAGALSLIFGLLVVVWPDSGALTIAWIIGIYAVVGGLALIGLSRRLHVRTHA
ncbi:HdeD family acid-resistance protein [Planotetraspora thailandica]|nr:HdeD family acid-resistance protein [Planotetraspora thailandica]